LQQRLDVVFAAIDLNSSILASMPAYTVKGTVTQPDPSWLTNPEPLAYVSWGEFIKELFWSYLLGEAFVLATARFAETSGGYPQRFMVVNPAFVQVDLVDGRRRYHIGDEDVTDDILHIRYVSYPGDARGHGPLEVAGARVLAVEALARYGSDLARRGGIPWAVLKYPKRATRAQMMKMQSDWVAARASAMGAPAVLADNVTIETLSTSPKDMALAELQQFNEARLAVLLGVPPFLLGLTTGDPNVYSNVTSIFDYHWRSSLRPKAQAVMSALSGWLLARGTGIELNRDEYVRPGLLERAQTYDILVRIGALTPDEVRAMERFTSMSAPASLTSATPQPQLALVPPTPPTQEIPA
jgi:HK97 family phage portal protein